MKLLFDQNLSFKLCERLAKLFPGSNQVRLVGLAETADRTIWDYAKHNGFVMVSLDVDFADRATLLGPPPKVIWLRCGNQPTERIEKYHGITPKRSLNSKATKRRAWRFTRPGICPKWPARTHWILGTMKESRVRSRSVPL